MIYGELLPKQHKSFYHLVPAHLLDSIDRRSVYGVCAIDEDRENYPAASMVFSVDGRHKALEILWFYVAEDYRKMHVADTMLGRFYAFTSPIEYETITVNVPVLPETTTMKNFFEIYTFSFSPTLSRRVSEPMDNLATHELFRYKKTLPESIIPFSKITVNQIAGYISGLPNKKSSERIRRALAGMDRTVSICHMEHGQISGCLLIQRHLLDTFEITSLRDRSKKHMMFKMLMLKKAYDLLKEQYDNPQIMFHCNRSDTAQIVDYLCPDVHPSLIWQGIYRMPHAVE